MLTFSETKLFGRKRCERVGWKPVHIAPTGYLGSRHDDALNDTSVNVRVRAHIVFWVYGFVHAHGVFPVIGVSVRRRTALRARVNMTKK